jgi:hypothetical protein
MQLAASHLVRAEAAVSCRGRGRSAVQNDRILRRHRATQSHVACVRWVGRGTRRLGARGGARARAGVRQPRPGCSIPTDCGETRTLASIL